MTMEMPPRNSLEINTEKLSEVIRGFLKNVEQHNDHRPGSREFIIKVLNEYLGRDTFKKELMRDNKINQPVFRQYAAIINRITSKLIKAQPIGNPTREDENYLDVQEAALEEQAKLNDMFGEDSLDDEGTRRALREIGFDV